MLRMRKWELVLSAISLLLVGCSEPSSRFDGFADLAPEVGSATDGSDEDENDVDDDEDDDDDGTGGRETSGSGGETESDIDPEERPNADTATGIRILAVQANQGVGIDVARGGEVIPATERAGALIHGRKTQLRATWQLAIGSQPRAIQAVLELSFPDGTVETLIDERNVGDDSYFGGRDTAFEWTIPQEDVVAGLRYEITLFETSSQGPDFPPSDPFPSEGPADLELDPTDLTIRVVAIPVVTPGGGVTATPELRQAFEDNLRVTFPVQDVEVTWRAPWNRSAKLAQEQDAFDYILDARDQDDVGVAYYHLLLDDDTCCDESGGEFDWGGLGDLITDDDVANGYYGDAVTRLYRGEDANGDIGWLGLDTVTHELGHNHGRDHAPCGGPAYVDEAFPYRGATIGVPGFDIVTERMLFPTIPDAAYGTVPTDFMAYCSNRWWSDYSWTALYERIKLRSRMHAHAPRMEGLELRGYVRPGKKTAWRIVRGPTNPTGPSNGPALRLRGADGGETSLPTRITYRPDSEAMIVHANVSNAPDFRSLEMQLESEAVVVERANIKQFARR